MPHKQTINHIKHLSYILSLQSLLLNNISKEIWVHSVAERSEGVCSGVHVRDGFFRVVIIHKGLLYVEIGW